tara:strand:- start:996 stop:1256 length:261 start_codon:yes stop_codon:yes gene_type:complete
MITITDAIISLSGGTAQVNIKNEDIDNIEWVNGTTPIAKEDILAEQTRLQEIENAKPSRETLKASAKAKLIAGEALTEEEANTIVL